MADFELKAVLEGFYFEHKVVVRDPTSDQLPYGGMPLLSLAGFTDYMGVECAADPDQYLGGLNNALRVYGVWPEKGPVPRYVLPATRSVEVQRRMEEASMRYRDTVIERVDAMAVRHQIEAQGGRMRLI